MGKGVDKGEKNIKGRFHNAVLCSMIFYYFVKIKQIIIKESY